MAITYARCDKCQHLVEVPNLVVGGGGAIVKITNSTAGRCPFCNSGTLRFLDGTYSLDDDVMSLLDGPQSSLDAWKELGKVLKASIEAGEAPDTTWQRIIAVAPELERYRRVGVLFFNVLAVALALKTGYDGFLDVTGIKDKRESVQRVEDSERGATRALEKLQREMRENSPPPPTEREFRKPDLPSNLRPMFVHFPITVKKLADYNQRRSEDQKSKRIA